MVTGTNLIAVRVIDLRSKRKVEELNDRLLFCLSNESSTGFQWALFARVLVALP